MSTQANTFKAIIKSAPSKIMPKSNGAEYVLINCEIIEGVLAGKIIPGTRTLKNGAGDEKSCPEIGDEVTLYHQYLESTTEEGKFKHFFEISTGLPQASDDELSALLGLTASVPAGQTL